MAQRPGATTVTGSQQQGSESQRPISQSWRAPPVSQGSLDLPGDSDGNEFVCSAGDPGSVPGSGRAPGEGKGNPLHYSCLENSMDRGAWWATVHGVSKSRTRSKPHPRGPGSTPRALRVQSPPRDPGSTPVAQAPPPEPSGSNPHPVTQAPPPVAQAPPPGAAPGSGVRPA